MLGLSVLTFSEFTVFPGLAALLPVLGTAMLIHAGAHGRTVVGSCLSIRPMVFIGLISYSLYLWHWPLLVLGAAALGGELSPAAAAAPASSGSSCAVARWNWTSRTGWAHGEDKASSWAFPRLCCWVWW